MIQFFIQLVLQAPTAMGRIWASAEDLGRNRTRMLSLYRQILRSLNSPELQLSFASRLAKKAEVRAMFWVGSDERSLHNIADLIDAADVHITGLAYSRFSELLVSYNDELIYLFEKNVGLGSSPSSATSEDLKNIHEAQVYSGHRNARTIKGVNFFGPNDMYVLSGSDCGHIFIWKKKGAKLVRLMVGDQYVVNQLEAHPHIPILASCGIEKNLKIWIPLGNDIPPLPVNVKEIMEANRQGREDRSRVTLTPDVIMHVLRLQRRQTLAYIERRYNREDIVSDEEDAEEYLLGFLDGDASSEEDSPGNSRDCNIS